MFNKGIKHDFTFINICKVPREVLKTEGEARGFQPSRGALRMLMNDKTMFDRYYCINSRNQCENEESIGALYFFNLITFSYASTLLKTMHDSGPVQILIILHVFCVAPGNKHNQKACINSTRSREFPDYYTAFVSVNTWQFIACSTGIYAIIKFIHLNLLSNFLGTSSCHATRYTC